MDPGEACYALLLTNFYFFKFTELYLVRKLIQTTLQARLKPLQFQKK